MARGSEEPLLLKRSTLLSKKAHIFSEKVHSFTKSSNVSVKSPLFHQKEKVQKDSSYTQINLRARCSLCSAQLI